MSLPSPSGACCRLVSTLLMALGVFCLLRCTHGDVTTGKKEKAPRQYAICLFGILRSPSIAFPTIKKHIFEPITNAGDTYDVFIHTYSMDVYSNPRAKEKEMEYNSENDLLQLNATRFLVTNQNDFDKSIGNSKSALYSKRYEYYQPTLKNLYRSRHSLELSWELMAEYASSQGVKYDGVIALRPDVAYVVDIDIASKDLLEDTVYAPSWFSWGGINDRFAFGHIEAMRVYMNRKEPIKRFSKKRINDEKFLKFHVENGGKKIAPTTMYNIRVRMDGSVYKKDLKIYRELCYNSRQITAGCMVIRRNAPTRV